MKKKLLLADDSITIQKVIAITFSSDDYQLTVVDNGVAALEKARAERPDLIMADVFMPGKNGYEVCAAVKGDPALQGVPVLLLTGTFEPFDEAKARQSGADKWIAKPFESQGLIDTVEALLRQAAVAPAPTAAATPPGAPRPMPGTPAPAQPAVAAAAPTAGPAPVRPIPGMPVAPPPAAAPAPPAPEPVLEEDIWGAGDELAADFGDLAAPDEFAPAESLPAAGADADLWGSISFDEPAPAVAPAVAIEPAAADSWGTLEDVFAAPPAAEVAPPQEIPLADSSIWGEIEEDLTSPQPELQVPLAAADWGGEEEMLPLDEVEILEEVELGGEELPPVEPSVEPALELSGYDGLAHDEILWEEPATAAVAPAAPAVAPPELAPAAAFMEEAFAGAAGAPIAPRPAAPAAEERMAALSEEELTRIVERVSGEVIERLANTVLERIAWEVVPDLAEALIKAELRKIRDEVEAQR